MTPQITALSNRLERGWELIDQARARNDHAEEAKLIEHWLRLEAEYRAACDAERAQIVLQHAERRSSAPDTVSTVSALYGGLQRATGASQQQMELRA